MTTDSTDALPLLPQDGEGKPKTVRKSALVQRLLGRAVYIPALLLLVFAGGVMGVYFQPPGIQRFFEVTGLAPGGGSDNPIAVSPELAEAIEAQQLEVSPNDIVALGTLLPVTDVIRVTTPFGASDAAIASIEVEVGDVVETGDVVAILDNLSTLEAELSASRSQVALREANLEQSRALTVSLEREAEATLQRAVADAQNAADEVARAQQLFDRGIVTRANLDTARNRQALADQEVERAGAVLERYTATSLDEQADVLVSIRNLEAALADLERAERNLARAYVLAPASGTVLDIHAHSGERPSTDGVVSIGDLAQMKADVEVYQTEIGLVEVGQPVQLSATALREPLVGTVSEIGLLVGRQTVLEDNPVANTDARVVTIEVLLDEPSSRVAARFTGLEVVARIDTGGEGS
ncbi:MAG: HlyD family efflux transporter periplasmic adaptor subunit [Devosiaceae bacterium]|nr:HlyD family efflux transporter periplasmic adaptor subunit [Devosiaceae bacterium MH13]